MNKHAAAFLLAAGALTGASPDPVYPGPVWAIDDDSSAPKPRELSPTDLATIRRAEERRAAKRARNLRNKERGA